MVVFPPHFHTPSADQKLVGFNPWVVGKTHHFRKEPSKDSLPETNIAVDGSEIRRTR